MPNFCIIEFDYLFKVAKNFCMKEIFFTFALCFVCALAQAKTNIIFDTDMGNDVDDALALNMLYGYQQKGLADIKAILINKDNPYSAVYVSIQNCHYNINVPIAAAKNAPKNTAHKNEHPNGKFIGKIADAKNADNSYKYKRSVFNGVVCIVLFVEQVIFRRC